MRTKLYISFILASIVLMLSQSCLKEDDASIWPRGQYDQFAMQKLSGFAEERDGLLASAQMSRNEFIRISTDSAWSLGESDKCRLRQVRGGVRFPSDSTILQKVIPLEDVALYINNTYGGTIGGFVSSAGDVKNLTKFCDVYYGLRLDYPGTKFSPGGGGYAVLRFTSNVTDNLSIPYCEEMGGTKSHSWPTTGGGFTSSSLGDGGFPEYTFTSYYAPNQGGELYEVTPAGNEILRAHFNGSQWIVIEPEVRITKSTATPEKIKNPIRNGIFARMQDGEIYQATALKGGKWQIQRDNGTDLAGINDLISISTFAEYKGFIFNIRGYDGQYYYLTTTDSVTQRGLSLISTEKGIYGTKVPFAQVNRVWETISDL